ncbi:MAG: hypothetical protein JSS02_01270 [Planctomycetes bacterium]|nr:hypothetical protein [Planctomycetota bacterium]
MRTLAACGLCLVVLTTPDLLLAQAGSGKSRGKSSLKDGITTYGDPPLKPGQGGKRTHTTNIEIELVTTGEGVGTKARDWADLFSRLETVVTVRNSRVEDKLGVTETKVNNSLRNVHVVGVIDPKGRLILPDQVLSLEDSSKVTNWVKDLRMYGAQGNPKGQPVWGLTKEQFATIHATLKKPLTVETKDVPVSQVVAGFEIPPEHPLVFTQAATRALKDRGENARVAQSFKGVSQGTALAALLADQGLGFRPRRLPDGKIELSVATRDEARDVWPVGWPRQAELPATAPALLQFKAIDLDEEPLDDLLDGVSEALQMPVLIDRAGLEAKHINLSDVKITFPLKKATWISALKEFTFKAKARPDVLLDDAGQPFLYIVPLDAPARAPKG